MMMSMSADMANGSDTAVSESIDTEMQDMVWEINAIIRDAGQSTMVAPPDYPTEMTIYEKV